MRQYLLRLMFTKATFKKNKYVFDSNVLVKTKKKSGKTLGKSRKIREFHRIKNWESWIDLCCASLVCALWMCTDAEIATDFWLTSLSGYVMCNNIIRIYRKNFWFPHNLQYFNHKPEKLKLVSEQVLAWLWLPLWRDTDALLLCQRKWVWKR